MADIIQKIIKSTFQFKRGNSADWASQHIVLAEGEPGLELDTGQLKIGDGVTQWQDLPHFLPDDAVLIPADPENNIPAFTQKDLIETITSATEGSVLTKQNGILTWTTPIQESDLVDIITTSNDIKEAIANKISQELENIAIGVDKLTNVNGVELILDCGNAN